MTSIETEYKFGHLYDQKTGKRILIEDGAKVVIVIEENSLLKEDVSISGFQPYEILNSDNKLKQVENKCLGDNRPYWKIKNAHEYLFFKIQGYIPKRDKKENFVLDFRLKLLEDLYITNKRKDPKWASLFDCKCVIDHCYNNDFNYFEPVYGTSLNKARTKLHELYFSRVANPASNAFNEFFESQNNGSYFGSLDDLRLKIQDTKK